MKKLIFFDVDDTLIPSTTHIIPKSTIEALQQLKQHYALAIATGRPFGTMLESGIQDVVEWDYYVCSNGQTIYDKERNIIRTFTIDSDAVAKVVETAQKRKEPVLLSLPHWVRIGDINPYVEEAHASFHVPIPDAIEDIPKDDVFMMILYGPKGYDYAPYQHIEGIDILPGHYTNCDIVKKGFHKGIGIQEVLRVHGCDSYIAFGDSKNDIEMLKQAEIGIAMGNASEDVFAHADFITKHIEEDGVAYAVKQLQLL